MLAGIAALLDEAPVTGMYVPGFAEIAAVLDEAPVTGMYVPAGASNA